MKKYVIIAFLLIAQLSQAASWFTSFEEAQKVALGTNKFMLVDFTASWCGPCRKMDRDSWNNEQVELTLENYVKVKIDIDANRELARKYGIQSIPNMLIMDGNGKVLHSFKGYHNAESLNKVLEKYSLSTEFLSLDLINFYKNKNLNTALKISQKYCDYSLLVDANSKEKILKISNEYLKEAKETVEKNDKNYAHYKQRLELFKLYSAAYRFEFEKVSEKLSEVEPEDIDQSNAYFYWFLKYISQKGLGLSTLETEDLLKQKDLENVIENSNELYACYLNSLKNNFSDQSNSELAKH
jgi:thioredoxin-related protein